MKNKNNAAGGRWAVFAIKIKNWGKKDRLILTLIAFIILLATLAGRLYFAYVPRQIKSINADELKEFSLLNPARKFIGQEDLIVNFQPLRDYLNEKYEKNSQVSVYFEFLNTGANISISKDAEFFPASLLKLPVAMAVVKKIEKGEWQWTNELVLMRNDKDDLFGSLHREPIGTPLTIEKLVEKMLVESDNTAYHILLRNLEPAELNDIHSHLGLQQFFSDDGKISAKRYSIIFRSLYNSSYLSEENSQKLLTLLSQTSFREYLGSALPETVRFSHKIGVSDEQHVFMDAGLVYIPNRPYLLTVMIQDGNQKHAEDVMKDISERVYKYVFEYKDAEK